MTDGTIPEGSQDVVVEVGDVAYPGCGAKVKPRRHDLLRPYLEWHVARSWVDPQAGLHDGLSLSREATSVGLSREALRAFSPIGAAVPCPPSSAMLISVVLPAILHEGHELYLPLGRVPLTKPTPFRDQT
jgi:hypothetical protein